VDRFTRVIHGISRRMCWASVFVISAMMVLTCADVVFRCFRSPIRGTYDIIGLLGGVIIALSLSYSHVMGRQVAVDSVFSKSRQVVQTIVNSITCLLSIGMIGLIAWRSVILGTNLWTMGRVSDTVRIPIFPFVYLLTFSCSIYCLVLVLDFFKLFKKADTK
jgi:TRAP-type C4-dicarboxylate transport system permease small subunit